MLQHTCMCPYYMWKISVTHSPLVRAIQIILLKITIKFRKSLSNFSIKPSTNLSKLAWLFSFSTNIKQSKISFCKFLFCITFWIFLLQALTMCYLQSECFEFTEGKTFLKAFHLELSSSVINALMSRFSVHFSLIASKNRASTSSLVWLLIKWPTG